VAPRLLEDNVAKGTVKIGPAINAKLYKEFVAVAKENGISLNLGRDHCCILVHGREDVRAATIQSICGVRKARPQSNSRTCRGAPTFWGPEQTPAAEQQDVCGLFPAPVVS
jgi:hypothetical protein